MASSYGRWYRRTRRYGHRTRRRPTVRRTYRRRYRRYSSRRRRTVSSVVKLTLESTWQLNTTNPNEWNVFSFSPVLLPGFKDYQTTYSHFRLLKARLYVNRQMSRLSTVNPPTVETIDGSKYNYLVVGSRPFAATVGPLSSSSQAADKYVPPQTTDALRQTKWQRVHYPNTTTQRVSVGFYPYTMVGTAGPVGTGNTSLQYQRVWEGKKWMPFNWSFDMATGVDRSVAFFGPYIAVDTPSPDSDPAAGLNVQCTLQVHVQFKGQR